MVLWQGHFPAFNKLQIQLLFVQRNEKDGKTVSLNLFFVFSLHSWSKATVVK